MNRRYKELTDIINREEKILFLYFLAVAYAAEYLGEESSS
jgi:hypothetical protein